MAAIKLLVENWRPATLNDMILPSRIRETLQSAIESKNIPNLLLSGPRGTGKTTAALCLVKDLNADSIFINASEDRGIDVIRDRINQFCSTVSFTPGVPKIVILDEADNMTPALIAALRGVIEKFCNTSRFLFTVNYQAKLPDPIQSRLQTISFAFDALEQTEMMKGFYVRVKTILEAEGITLESEKALAAFIKTLFPDMRKVLNELDNYSRRNGKVIDEGILAATDDGKVKEFIKILREKNWNRIRKFVESNGDSAEWVYNCLWLNLETVFANRSIPEAVLIIAEYVDKHGRSFNKKITLAGCLTQLIGNCEIK